LKRADAFGIKGLLIASKTVEEVQNSLQLCELKDNMFTTIGLHPYRIDETYKHLKTFPNGQFGTYAQRKSSLDKYFAEYDCILKAD
jgi:Tat protein secretion system quality control protein TatD with DNase activity